MSDVFFNFFFYLVILLRNNIVIFSLSRTQQKNFKNDMICVFLFFLFVYLYGCTCTGGNNNNIILSRCARAFIVINIVTLRLVGRATSERDDVVVVLQYYRRGKTREKKKNYSKEEEEEKKTGSRESEDNCCYQDLRRVFLQDMKLYEERSGELLGSSDSKRDRETVEKRRGQVGIEKKKKTEITTIAFKRSKTNNTVSIVGFFFFFVRLLHKFLGPYTRLMMYTRTCTCAGVRAAYTIF